jgi:hypothetical protein
MARYSLIISSDLKGLTVIAAAMVMFGTVLMDARFDQVTKLPTEILNRPFGIGLKQIEYCIFQERRNDQTALFPTFAEDDHRCPIEQKLWVSTPK